VESVQFRHGATLKFMSGGGSDKSRAGFTSRVVVVTETDGLDKPGSTSRESDKLTQLEARTRAYGSRKRIYLECTVSTEEGRTWQEYQNGTRSRIVLPCPRCGAWISPEREHLLGWREADTQAAARQQGTFSCPACDVPWSEQERIGANVQCRLLHEGQSLTAEGEVQGTAPATETLGFRWSAVHNLFATAADLASDEWRASRSSDEENAEREMRQFVWCIPTSPTHWSETPLALMELAARMDAVPRGLVPNDARVLTAALDIGKYLCHWVVVAWSEGATGHVVDYGRIEVASRDLGVEQGVLVALKEFGDRVLEGWPRIGTPTAAHLIPDKVWIDSGYMTDVVYAYCRQTTPPRRFFPAIGRGAAQQRHQWYNRPTRTGSIVQHIGEGFHINHLEAEHLYLVEVNADHWKTWVHARLATPLDHKGALSFYAGQPQEHLTLARHLTAETKVEEFVAGKGLVTRWERVRRQNHWLDALYNACAAGSLCGVRLLGEDYEPAPSRPRLVSPEVLRPDGRPWIDMEGWREMAERFGL
jgi:phage terminase large subunit GpA-like protein